MEADDLLCSRNARCGLPSLGLMARSGKSIAKQSEGRAGERYLPVDGRVRRLRAVEDQSAPIPEEKVSKLGGSICIVRCAQLGSSHPSLMRTTMIYTYVLNRGPAGFVVRWMDFEPPYGGAVMRIRIRCWANY